MQDSKPRPRSKKEEEKGRDCKIVIVRISIFITTQTPDNCLGI
jgi:hypothetical protein